MIATIVEESGTKVKLQIEIDLKGTMLEMEGAIQEGINELGNLATGKALKKFDTDGTNIRIGEITLTSKGEVSQTYQTPYGDVAVDRHLYQSSRGGQTYCPLEKEGRITPFPERFSQNPCFIRGPARLRKYVVAEKTRGIKNKSALSSCQ